MDNKELFLAVNPVFATAKGCLALLKHTGIKEASDLANIIDTTVQNSSDTPKEIGRAYMISNEARYHIGNIMAAESGCDVITDLPCGYVPRGLAVSGKGMTFYGFDLPAVIEELEPAIRSIATDEQNRLMHFAAVDATNYESLRSALSEVNGKICILTDGLLGYFNKPELDSVCDNIRRLLTEHGGVWITADKFSLELGAETFSALTGSDGEVIMQMMARGGAKVADIPVTHTVIHDGSEEEARKYFNEHGFIIRELTYADKVPELLSLKDSPEDMAKLREAYKRIKIWVMSVNAGSNTKSVESRKFRVEFHCDDNKILTCSITGRLDTITAPDLLTGFNENKKDDLKEITVDLAETEYISSAGLRVLLMMCKSLSDSKNFHIINYSEDILEILNVTGFAELFGM